MAGLINELIVKIGDMASIIESLTELAHEKKDVIIKNETDNLKAITAQENTLVGRYQRTEKAVSAIMDDIAMVLNQQRKTLTLGTIAEMIKEQDDYDEYSKGYERLKKNLELLKERNDMNNILISNALDYIDYSVNVLRSTYGSGNDVMIDTRN